MTFWDWADKHVVLFAFSLAAVLLVADGQLANLFTWLLYKRKRAP